MRENADQNTSEYEHFLRSDINFIQSKNTANSKRCCGEMCVGKEQQLGSSFHKISFLNV